MKILALDLAYTGPTGVIYINDWEEIIKSEVALPMIPAGATVEDRYSLVIKHWVAWGKRWKDVILDDDVHIVYEYTDWHQDASDDSKYARERRNQAKLGYAAGTVATIVFGISGKDCLRIGATYAKEQFTGQKNASKRTVLKVLSATYPDYQWEKYDENVRDAAMIAFVALADLRLRDLITNSE